VGAGNQPPTVLADDDACSQKGLAMLIRGQMYGVEGEAVRTAGPGTIPAASLPTLHFGGLLLLICP